MTSQFYKIFKQRICEVITRHVDIIDKVRRCNADQTIGTCFRVDYFAMTPAIWRNYHQTSTRALYKIVHPLPHVPSARQLLAVHTLTLSMAPLSSVSEAPPCTPTYARWTSADSWQPPASASGDDTRPAAWSSPRASWSPGRSSARDHTPATKIVRYSCSPSPSQSTVEHTRAVRLRPGSCPETAEAIAHILHLRDRATAGCRKPRSEELHWEYSSKIITGIKSKMMRLEGDVQNVIQNFCQSVNLTFVCTNVYKKSKCPFATHLEKKSRRTINIWIQGGTCVRRKTGMSLKLSALSYSTNRRTFTAYIHDFTDRVWNEHFESFTVKKNKKKKKTVSYERWSINKFSKSQNCVTSHYCFKRGSFIAMSFFIFQHIPRNTFHAFVTSSPQV